MAAEAYVRHQLSFPTGKSTLYVQTGEESHRNCDLVTRFLIAVPQVTHVKYPKAEEVFCCIHGLKWRREDAKIHGSRGFGVW